MDKKSDPQSKKRRKGHRPFAPAQIADFIERISDGFVAFDAEMNYTYVNQRGAELLGRKPEDLIGKNYWIEYPEARETPFARAYVRALETQQVILLEDYYEPWDRWFENRIYPSRNGLSILFTEITERKKAESAMQEQNRLISALVDTTPGYVYIYDYLSDRNVYANAGIEYLLGYSTEQVKGMGTRLFGQLLHPNDLSSVAAAQTSLKSAGDNDTLELEYRMLHADGNWRWLRSYERPFARNMDGSIRQKFGIALDVTAHKQAEERIQQQLKRLSALRMIDIAINSSFDLRVVLNIVLQYIISQLGVDAGAVLLLKPQLQSMDYVASRGFQTVSIQGLSLKGREGYADQAMTERRTIYIRDFLKTSTYKAQSSHFAKEGFVDYYSTPLIVKGDVKGVLEMYHRSALNLNPEQLEFFETLAGQAAIAIDNAQLFSGIQQAHTELIVAYDDTIAGWSRAMALRDQEAEGHAQRVTDLTVTLARVMNIPDSQLGHLRRGAILHDIGKMAIPDHILLKPEPLTEEETRIIQKHPAYGYELLSPIGYLQPALDIPYCHHEKWDGTGYPRGLKGEEIPIAARIFAVVDAWDSITSDHLNQKAMSRERALEHISAQSGKHFDPKVVDVFLRLISDQDRSRTGSRND